MAISNIIPFFGIFIALHPYKANIVPSESNVNPKNVILIFPDSQRQQDPLYAVWKERKQRWYITKAEEKEENKIDIRNAIEVLSSTEFVKALESGRYFLSR